MFVLTCPECDHTTKVRFARMGATATCPECQHQYKVARETMVVEEDDHAKPEPTETLTFGQSEVEEEVEAGAEPGPKKSKAGINVDDVLMESGAEHMIGSDARRASARQRLKRRKQKSDGPIIALSLVSMVALIGFIVWLADPFGEDPVPPPSNGGQTTNTGNGGDPPDKPDVPIVNTPNLPDLPMLRLTDYAQPDWLVLNPPSGAMRQEPPPGLNVQLYRAQFDNGGRLGPMITLMFMADVPGVYTGAKVKIQLVNERDQAIGELNMDLPDIAPRVGLFHHVTVPPALADQTKRIVSNLIITKAEPDYLMLEQNISGFKVLVDDFDKMILQVQVHNPNDQPISNPQFMLQSYLVDGRLHGWWSARLDKKVSAGGNVSFMVTIPKPLSSQGRLGRFIVQGYGGS